MAGVAGGCTSDNDSAVITNTAAGTAWGASHDGVATSAGTGADNAGSNGMSTSLSTGRSNISTRLNTLLADDTLHVDGRSLQLFGAGLNTGCESQQGDGGGCEVHFYWKTNTIWIKE